MKASLRDHKKNHIKYVFINMDNQYTTSFWNIIIQWTSYDDLTEKSAETFFQFTVWCLKKKNLAKWQKVKTALWFDKKLPRGTDYAHPLARIACLNKFLAWPCNAMIAYRKKVDNIYLVFQNIKMLHLSHTEHCA